MPVAATTHCRNPAKSLADGYRSPASVIITRKITLEYRHHR
jgi:hypothetical protein